jgi:hypothetical protein
MKATSKQGTSDAVQFFYEHAGYSYDPLKETREQGRRRCARGLANAEAKGSSLGFTFEWDYDGMDSSEWTDERQPATPTWVCVCRNGAGEIVESLHGVDFGDKEPWGESYRRVVEAELAAAAL